VIVWRITRAGKKTLSGEGARLYGGRWNSEGRAAIYSSATLSLAVLEYLVHLEPSEIPSDLVTLKIEIPDEPGVGAVADPARFDDRDWRMTPAPPWQAELGDAWLEDGTFLWLAVPSAVVPEERNILVNPAHRKFGKVRVRSERPFPFDLRLLK